MIKLLQRSDSRRFFWLMFLALALFTGCKKGFDAYYGYGRVDMYEALNYGKSPSGKKDRVIDNDKRYEEPPVYEKTRQDDDLKAKAKDPNDDDKYRTKHDDDKRAKKPNPDNK